MTRVILWCIAVLVSLSTAACGGEDDQDKAAGLVREACEAYGESTGGAGYGEGSMPAAPQARVDKLETAVDRAEEAAELDDDWVEFSTGMSRIQSRQRAEAEAMESGIPPPPDPLFFAALETVGSTCRDAGD